MAAETSNVEQPTVLIISDEPDFSRAVMGRWQTERSVPAFTLLKGDVCRGTDPETFDMAVVGTLRHGILPAVLATLEPSGRPVVLVCQESQGAQEVRQTQPRVMVLRRQEGWLDALVMVSAEVLGRCEALARAHRVEQSNKLLEREATLGRYMLEMRHTLNNALTAVLGNSELLLLEPGSLSAVARSQIETVRHMAVRMHEILQRLSSIEAELSVLEKQAEKEERLRSQTAAAC